MSNRQTGSVNLMTGQQLVIDAQSICYTTPMSPKEVPNYSMISDTAKFPAYLRSFTDLPHAKKIYNFIQQHSSSDTQQLAGLNYSEFLWLAPLTEARQKFITKTIEQLGFDLILELGSGFTLRWESTKNYKVYIDTDLPETIALKQTMIASLPISIPRNVYLADLNPLTMNLRKFVRKFSSGIKTVAIAHEGLTQYFSRDEIKCLAENIRDLAQEYDVSWITPDFSTKTQYLAYESYDQNMKTLSAARKQSSGRDLMANAFESEMEISEFFNDLGFTTKRHQLLEDAAALSSMKIIPGEANGLISHFQQFLNFWHLAPK